MIEASIEHQAAELARRRGWRLVSSGVWPTFERQDGTALSLSSIAVAELLRIERAQDVDDEDAAVELALLRRTRALQVIRDWALGPWPLDGARVARLCTEALESETEEVFG